MKANSTREMIDYSRAWRKEGMEGIKTLHNAIEAFVDIFDGAFKLCLLSCSELRGGDVSQTSFDHISTNSSTIPTVLRPA